jgi:hypothetical protein
VPIHLGTNMKATGNADWIGEPELRGFFFYTFRSHLPII